MPFTMDLELSRMLSRMVSENEVSVLKWTSCTAESVVPGGGAFEVAAQAALTSPEFLASVQGRAKYGVKVSRPH